jgi:hypothetical protein
MLRKTASVLLIAVALAFAGCDTADNGESLPPPGDGPIPLIDFDEGETYHGFEGQLYEGANTPPVLHVVAGEAARAGIEPLDAQGDPDLDGKIVFLSIGMSNVTEEFCSHNGAEQPEVPCTAQSFMGQASGDPDVDRSNLVIVDGAMRGLAGEQWDASADPAYDYAADALAVQDVTPEQVQVVWTKVALGAEPSRPLLPDPRADAFYTVEVYGDVIRALKARYPNLRQVFLSSRIYGGYASLSSNTPEPWAYETGFATKWLIEAQIAQRETGRADARAGDLLPDEVFVDWGPYMWANGTTPRSDGLTWPRSDFASDGQHPSESGEAKVAGFLLEFFKTSPYTSCWFMSGQTLS